MKWLKKDSSDIEQVSKAESQPEPEHDLENTPSTNNAPEPETLEQPVEDETESLQVQTKKQSARRRDKRTLAEEDKKPNSISKSYNYLQKSWVGQHWKTFVILFAIFCLAFFARAYFGLEPATENGFVLSGGSDSYYHHWIITNGYETGDLQFYDYMLNYPVASSNPRPPLYDWSVTLTGKALAPFFDGGVYSSTFYVFIFSTAFWGALTIYPTYFLGKEAFGRKTGIIAAFLLAVLPGHVQRSVLTNADHDAITLFFIVTAFFFFLKALKTITHQEWTEQWKKPKDISQGIKSFIQANPLSILYGILAGVSLAAVALVWQGFAYAIVLISVYFLIQILLNRLRNVDSFGIFFIYFVTIATGLLLSFPYYSLSYQVVNSWFETPTYLFLGLSAFALILILTRKYPWLLVFSVLTVVGLISLIALDIFAHSFYHTMVNTLLSGGGYFINNKQYQTIAEAQAPPFSNLALSFGIFTFWLSFIGVAWAAIQLPKSWKPDFTFIILWSGVSIYMAVTAARFMFNAAPAFAITAAWVVAIIIEKLDFKKYIDDLKRASKPHMTYNFKIGLIISIAVLLIMSVVLTSFSNVAYPIFVLGLTVICGIYMLNLISETNPNRLYNILAVLVPASGALFYLIVEFYTDYVITDATHIFILSIMLLAYLGLYLQVRRISFFFTIGVVFLAFCIVVPNVWAGLDAGIPYETKPDYDKEIYDSMPIFMQPSDYDVQNGTNWYLGGFGYSLPLNSRYWPAAYDWLATQDTNIYPLYDRPAFISWWDYGFEVINEGQHPTVADNFLAGHQLAGNFIMAQSEKDAIALLCVRLLEGNWYEGHWIGDSYNFDSEIISLFDEYGIDSAKMINIFENPSSYVDTILANPDIYGPRDDVVQDANAKYIASRVLLTESLDEEQIVNLYNDISILTGKSIRYFGIDSRLFPFSAQNTGIFYAPAKLSDHRISDTANQPYDFWEIKAVGEFGGEYDLNDIPPDVNLDPTTPYKIVYKEMFYDSMLYRAFIGYSGYDLGQGEAGIPGLSGSLSSSQIMPGWNMSHFKLVHRTAYWNPYSASEIQNHTDAWTAMNYWDAYEKQQAGDGISDLSDRSSIYQGAMMLKYYHGAMISGKVTLDDGTPLKGISLTVTDDFGIPHQQVVTDDNGLYSIIAPPGEVKLTASIGDIDPLTLVGTPLNTTSLNIEDYQAMRVNEDRNNDGRFDYLIDQDIVIKSSSMHGSVYWDIDSNGAMDDSDELVSGAQVSISNNQLGFNLTTDADEYGLYQFPSMMSGNYSVKISFANLTIGSNSVIISPAETKTQNLGISVTTLNGTVQIYDNLALNNVKVKVWNTELGIDFETYTNEFGSYTFNNILFGRFFAQAEWDVYASTPQLIEIKPFQNNTVNFTLAESVLLSGITYLNGMPVPFTTIKFAGASDVITTSDSSGKYSIRLSPGDYVYYCSHFIDNSVYNALGRMLLYDDTSFDIELQSGSIVTGRVMAENEIFVADTQVVFDNLDTGIYVSATTDTNGDYSITVPIGRYRIQVSSSNYGYYYARHNIYTKIISINVTTTPGVPMSGTIFWDADKDGAPDTDEILSGASITFKDPSGQYAQANTDDTGTFTVFLHPTTPYLISISKPGFQTVDLGAHTPSSLSNYIAQSLEPIIIPISGKVYLDGDVITDQNILLDFISENAKLPSTEFQVGRDGSYSGRITPGRYKVTFTHNISIGDDTKVYQILQDLLFETGYYNGSAIYLDIEAIQRTKVIIEIDSLSFTGANITFKQGPDYRTFDMETNYNSYYVKPGDYILAATHALDDALLVYMQKISVDEDLPNTFTISLLNAISYSGTLKYGNNIIPYQKITFQDVESNGSISVATDESGKYFVNLVPNLTYNVIVDFVDFVEDPHLLAYRYYSGNQSFYAMVSKTDRVIILEREIYSFMLNGSTMNNGLIAPFTELMFLSDVGNYTVTSDSEGRFSLSIVPSEYTLYSHKQSSHIVSLSRTFISIDQSDLSVDLVSGKRLYGTVYYERNLNAATKIIFKSTDGVEYHVDSDDQGYYEVWLPEGTYDINSELNTVKNDIDVTYSLDMEVELDSDRQMNLPLSMIEDRIVFVSFDMAQMVQVRPNTTHRYYFDIENMGNIRDTYQITAVGGNPDWVVELSSTEITIDPGVTNKARLSLSAFIPEDAKQDQNTITITATSQKDPTKKHSNVMNIPIQQKHAISIQPSAAPAVFDSGKIQSEFTVLNNGNGAEKLTAYVANTQELEQNGWEIEFGSTQGTELVNEGTRIINVSISSGGSLNIPVYLNPSSDNPSRQVTALIIAYSQIDGTIITSNNILIKYPQLQISSSNLTAAGTDVSEMQSGDQLTNASVMIISVASALLLFYFARKKRWIR